MRPSEDSDGTQFLANDDDSNGSTDSTELSMMIFQYNPCKGSTLLTARNWLKREKFQYNSCLNH